MLAKSQRYFLVAVVALTFPIALTGCPPITVTFSDTPTASEHMGPGEFLFCHWNVENFFDDKHDKRSHMADREFDDWLASHPDILQQKLAKMTEAMLKLNEGKGPDILAVCEVESVRAAELLMAALNKKLDPKYHYKSVLMKEVQAGRHIAPAIITRLPVNAAKTKLHGKMLRILEGRIIVDNKELIILASHWTSRIQAGSDAGRDKYADAIYRAFQDYHQQDPHVNLLVCGDFNDTPHDDSVTGHLHAVSDINAVKSARPPLQLYNLFGNKDASAGFGTHFYSGKWYLFDQIVVSPALVSDGSWRCDVNSVQTINTLFRPGDNQRRPWRFGDEKTTGPRGYSDHFPVTVKLKVQ